jgi:hypothetical protein
MSEAGCPGITLLGSSVNRGNPRPNMASLALDGCATSGHGVAEEIEAKNFVLYIGHLGRSESLVQPTTSKKEGGSACEALHYGSWGNGDNGGYGCG